MAAERAGPDLPEPFGMIDETEVFLDLDMPHVVPIAELGRIQFVEERGQLAFARDFFVTTPAFHAESDVFLLCVFGDALEGIFHALEIWWRGRLARLNGLYFQAHVFPR